MNNIILIGMPGAGKSTIGVILAKTMGFSFLDTDILIQNKHNDLLQNIVDKNGIKVFKQIEEESLLEVNVCNTVISTGGSAVYSAEAIEYLKKNGAVIYLELSLSEVERRINNISTRGIVMNDNQTLADLYEERKPLYERHADITIKCDSKNIENIIEEILKLIHFEEHFL